MSNHTTRLAPPRPASTPPDCRHSRQPFDTAFRVINERRDISPAAKLVHAHLVTLLRTGREATQTEIGDALGMSRHQVWRAVSELVAAELVQTVRYGLGRPNGYVLLGLAEDDIRGRASARPAPRGAVAGLPGPRARGHSYQKKTTERTVISDASAGLLQSRQPGRGNIHR